MKSIYINEAVCAGCTACLSICPKSAITMQANAKGFLYPVIDSEICINCGLCRRVCDFSVFRKTEERPESYAVRHKNKEEVATSRSGGFFSALARFVIEKQGVVYGAVLDDDLIVRHKGVATWEECVRFKGSKYVQSEIGSEIFHECCSLLQNERWVLFSGTGCQVHGLISFLKVKKVDMQKLITVDFVCHGVPSPAVWKEYTDVMERDQHDTLLSVDFRDKDRFGWAAHKESYTFEASKTYGSNWAEMYYQHVMFRDCCYQCPYTTTKRNSDFTMGDYWGIGKLVPEINDDLGVSLVLVQNERSHRILNEIKENIECYPTDLLESLQPQLCRPVRKGREYHDFWTSYLKDPSSTIEHYFFPRGVRKIRLQTEKKMKRLIKKILEIAGLRK